MEQLQLLPTDISNLEMLNTDLANNLSDLSKLDNLTDLNNLGNLAGIDLNKLGDLTDLSKLGDLNKLGNLESIHTLIGEKTNLISANLQSAQTKLNELFTVKPDLETIKENNNFKIYDQFIDQNYNLFCISVDKFIKTVKNPEVLLNPNGTPKFYTLLNFTKFLSFREQEIKRFQETNSLMFLPDYLKGWLITYTVRTRNSNRLY